MSAAVGCCTSSAAAPCALARRQSSSYRATTIFGPNYTAGRSVAAATGDRPFGDQVAGTDRVCAYDRPGTLRYIDGAPLTDRSTAVAQPRTVEQLAVELKALLGAARVSGPYVLVGHSLGGLISLL